LRILVISFVVAVVTLGSSLYLAGIYLIEPRADIVLYVAIVVGALSAIFYEWRTQGLNRTNLNLSIGELRLLAREDNHRDRIEKLFDWGLERHKLIVQGLITFLVTLSVGIATAALKDEINKQTGLLLLIVLAGLGGPILLLSSLLFPRSLSLDRKYMATLHLLDLIRRP
jgi:hypothetical protein